MFCAVCSSLPSAAAPQASAPHRHTQSEGPPSALSLFNCLTRLPAWRPRCPDDRSHGDSHARELRMRHATATTHFRTDPHFLLPFC
ncbi:hypothetical protein JZ751_009053 [Albula glossodonta]|uniref:Uncharacterized protein n=1 Tax=Albula glossodonta TaxID=121402 RepID=A0A8T2PB21_9TELE|nr:hypothetical protein JZ751_009053 [Albula glossodonta]